MDFQMPTRLENVSRNNEGMPQAVSRMFVLAVSLCLVCYSCSTGSKGMFTQQDVGAREIAAGNRTEYLAPCSNFVECKKSRYVALSGFAALKLQSDQLMVLVEDNGKQLKEIGATRTVWSNRKYLAYRRMLPACIKEGMLYFVKQSYVSSGMPSSASRYSIGTADLVRRRWLSEIPIGVSATAPKQILVTTTELILVHGKSIIVIPIHGGHLTRGKTRSFVVGNHACREHCDNIINIAKVGHRIFALDDSSRAKSIVVIKLERDGEKEKVTKWRLPNIDTRWRYREMVVVREHIWLLGSIYTNGGEYGNAIEVYRWPSDPNSIAGGKLHRVGRIIETPEKLLHGQEISPWRGMTYFNGSVFLVAGRRGLWRIDARTRNLLEVLGEQVSSAKVVNNMLYTLNYEGVLSRVGFPADGIAIRYQSGIKVRFQMKVLQ